ncbi:MULTISPECIES: hypothetical protein [Aeromonas]|uniref:hypothetical protein n=1 Tax=Aeromonas ichthyocola TaxID=3367746 RepID=UPI0038EBC638
MQLTDPQPPQADDFEALRTGLNCFNEAVTGQLLRERISSFIKNEDGWCRAVFWGKYNGADVISGCSEPINPCTKKQYNCVKLLNNKIKNSL